MVFYSMMLVSKRKRLLFNSNLNKSGLFVARRSLVTFEALTEAGIIVTLTSSTTFVVVVVSGSSLSDGRVAEDLDASHSGGAAFSAFQVLEDEEVLGTLNIVTIEGHHELEGASAEDRGRHSHTINHVVRESQESILHVVSESEVRRSEVDGGGGEGLIDLRLEGKSEGIRRREGIERFHTESLNLVEESIGEIQSFVHHIVRLGAHSSRAVDISVMRIAEATSGLLHIPVIVSEVVHGSLVNGAIVVTPHRAEGEVLKVLASAVARAVVGAGGSLAAFASVTLEALTFAGGSVADTSARALSVLVDVTINIGIINPSDFERADSCESKAKRQKGKTAKDKTAAKEDREKT